MRVLRIYVCSLMASYRLYMHSTKLAEETALECVVESKQSRLTGSNLSGTIGIFIYFLMEINQWQTEKI